MKSNGILKWKIGQKMLRFRSLTVQMFNTQKNNIIAASYSTKQPIKEQKIKVSKWNINYIKVGSGEHTVLCMPGALGTIWTDFKPQIEGFDREKFTVVVWDPPGYGKSRPPDKDFATDFFERDAECALEFMQALEIPRYSILGWSDGGITGLIHAAKYPDATHKLVIFGSNSFILPQEIEATKKIKDVSAWSEKMKKPMTDIYGDFFPTYWSNWVDGYVNIFNANNGNICAQMLKDIKCPTFVLYGEKDPLVAPVHATDFLTNIPDSRLHLYPDGKHNIHLRYAEDFNKRVQDFLIKA